MIIYLFGMLIIEQPQYWPTFLLEVHRLNSLVTKGVRSQVDSDLEPPRGALVCSGMS